MTLRILIHSNAPTAKTGYGQQTMLLAPRLQELGHEVAISAFHGVQAGPSEWRGIKLFPAGQHPYGGDVVGNHARWWGADLVFTIMDLWVLPHDTLEGLNVASWMPIDAEPLSLLDVNRLESTREMRTGIMPVAMSRFGERMLNEAGYHDVYYVPHMISTDLFCPPGGSVDSHEERSELRRAVGLDDKFVIMMNAANYDKWRKGYPEQFCAFAKFAKRHDDVILVVHALKKTAGGLDLETMAARLGIADKVKFSDQYLMVSGQVEAEHMRNSYGCADLFSGAALGEGFGLPLIEAQACGVPVVTTNGSAMAEVGAPGYLVNGELYWAPGHNSWWRKPAIDKILAAYEKAYQRGPQWQRRRAAARAHAEGYDCDVVMEKYWKPVLADIERRIRA